MLKHKRKPVLKEKTSFFGKAFFEKERFVLKEKKWKHE
jgi:hypothetical protein